MKIFKTMVCSFFYGGIIFFLSSCFFSDKPTSNNGDNLNDEDATHTCSYEGTVKSFDGLNTCGLLIETFQGDRYLPEGIPEGAQLLKNGMKIKFNFEVLQNRISTCMAEKAIIKITCLEVLSMNNPCEASPHIDDIVWVQNKMRSLNPISIKEFKSLEMTYYQFKCKNGMYFYNCEGEFLCEQKRGSSNCYEWSKELEKGELVYRK